MQSCASRLQWSEYQKLCGGKAYKCIGLTDWFLVWDESLQNVENVFRIFKMLRSCRSFKMLQRCELSMLQMLHAILLKPKNVATILQGSFLEKVCNLAEFNNNKNFFLECCRAYRCCSAFNEGCLYLVYYACHVKLNILGTIVIPDNVAPGSSEVFCFRNQTGESMICKYWSFEICSTKLTTLLTTSRVY